jgi:hypothetical protein
VEAAARLDGLRAEAPVLVVPVVPASDRTASEGAAPERAVAGALSPPFNASTGVALLSDSSANAPSAPPAGELSALGDMPGC